MMTKLILVRHGQSQANIDSVFAGHTNTPLSELGVLQANKTAEFLKENYKIDIAYASDLQRAYNTGKTIADKQGIQVIKSNNLREIYAGVWEGLSFIDIKERFPDSYKTWKEDIGNALPNEGESVSELQFRIINEIKEIACKNENKTILIATHATPIRSLLCYIKGLPLSEMHNVPWVSNSSITVMDYENDSFNIILEGYDKHLGNSSSTLSKIV